MLPRQKTHRIEKNLITVNFLPHFFTNSLSTVTVGWFGVLAQLQKREGLRTAPSTSEWMQPFVSCAEGLAWGTQKTLSNAFLSFFGCPWMSWQFLIINNSSFSRPSIPFFLTER
jgi:hypothetical protein